MQLNSCMALTLITNKHEPGKVDKTLIAVGRPRYQRARLVGERLVADLATEYLAEVSQRLRPGSYKSVRFALDLLTSHLGKHSIGELSLNHERWSWGISPGSIPTCKYRQGKDAGLVYLANLSVASEDTDGISLVVISY